MSEKPRKWHTYAVRRSVGVYMLYGLNGLLYIGQSKNIEYRVSTHLYEGKIPFNRVVYTKCRVNQLDQLEKELIEEHNPPFNHTHTERAHRTRGPIVGLWRVAQPQP